MDLYGSRERSGSNSSADLWGPFRGKYPDPTPEEFDLIWYYLRRFACEVDDFVERRAFRSLKNRLNSPNLRHQLVKFLRQVRETKGYDVDLYFDFIAPPYPNFIPRNLDDNEFYDEAMAAATVAIREINTRMVSAGKRYELVSVDKSVLVTRRSSKEIPGELRKRAPFIIKTLLLTFTANEIILAARDDHIDDNGTSVVVLQAMLVESDGPPSTFQLKEWKYKPVPNV